MIPWLKAWDRAKRAFKQGKVRTFRVSTASAFECCPVPSDISSPHRVLMKSNWRVTTLLVFIFGSLVWMFTLSPIPQDTAFHLFADSRSWLGIPNFLDVMSNIPFFIAGVLGLIAVRSSKEGSPLTGWLVLFAGIVLVSAGSAYYHWSPDNATLVWDRLPMTVGFMGLFVALSSEYVNEKLLKTLLIPAILVGAASVWYWHLTDDLRLYAWVQFMPLGSILIYLTLFKSRYTHSRLLLFALGLYVLAKVAETYDVDIYEAIGGLASGHTIKHLLAAAGCYALVVYVRNRQLISSAHDSHQ